MNQPPLRTWPGASALHGTRWAFWLPLLAFALYAMMLVRYSAACASGSDSSGYMNNARMLDQGSLSAPMRRVQGLDPVSVSSFAFVPLGFTPGVDRASLVPVYPMGLPLAIMAAAHVVGWDLAPTLTIVFHALFGLWLMYLLGRKSGLEAGWAWLGVMLLAASPLYILMSLELMSDVPAMMWVSAAVLCAWKSRERPWLAFLAGAAAALAVLDRPTNLLVFVPVGVALGTSIRRWLLLSAGGLPGAFLLGIVNEAAYGRIFTSGYGPLEGLFSAANVPVTLLHYALWLPALFTPLVVLCLGLPLVKRHPPPGSGVLAAWALVFPGFYLFYRHTHETWWALRFILPALPPMLVAAVLVARALAGRCRLAPRAWWLAVAAAALLIFGRIWFWKLGFAHTGASEQTCVECASWSASHLPANAVVASMQTSGALFYYTKFTLLRWDAVSPAEFERIAAACAAAGRPVFALLYPFEIEEQGAFRRHLTGRWTPVASIRRASVWRLESPGGAR